MMFKRSLTLAAVSAAALFSTMAQADGPAKMSGGMLVDSAGMTVYTFDKDTTAGKSACNGPCAKLWPPVMAAADAKPDGSMTVISRDDGEKQWAYKGKPVYTYSMDKKAGDMTGDNFKDVWHVVK